MKPTGLVDHCIVTLAFCSILISPPRHAWAEEPPDSEITHEKWDWSDAEAKALGLEPNWSTSDLSLTDNLRWAIDMSSRVSYASDSRHFSYTNVVGIDIHKVFTGIDGDWGTLIIQEYLTRFDNLRPRPFFIEGEDDWELFHRITNFNYTGLFKGRLNFKAGHIEIPFGIEVPINTNRTLRQLNTLPNLGVKTDWGAGVNGKLPGWEYEVVLSRGTGQEYHSKGGPFVVSGRIGTPSDDIAGFGLSGFYGQVLGGRGTTRRTRFAADGWWNGGGPIGLLGELSIGDDEGRGVINFLAEANWLSRENNWHVYGQFRGFNKRLSSWEDTETIAAGLRWTPTPHWALSAQWTQSVSTLPGVPKSGVGMVQARYRFF